MTRIDGKAIRVQFMEMVRRGRPARAITKELGAQDIQRAKLISKLSPQEQLAFCFNLLGSIHSADVEFALDMLPRDKVLGQIYKRLMENRYVNPRALNFYADAPEVTKDQFYDVLGISGPKENVLGPIQAIKEALTEGEDQIQAGKRFSKAVLSEASALFKELNPKTGNQTIIIDSPQPQIPDETKMFIKRSVSRLLREELVEQSELEKLAKAKGSAPARLIVARHPQAEQAALTELAFDRSDMVSRSAYENLKARGLIDDNVRSALVKAEFWWVRRQVIKDPGTKKDVLLQLADRYTPIIVRIMKNEVRRGLVSEISDPKVIPSKFPRLEIALALLLKLGIYNYPHEALELVERLCPNFGELRRQLFDQVATERDEINDLGQIRG